MASHHIVSAWEIWEMESYLLLRNFVPLANNCYNQSTDIYWALIYLSIIIPFPLYIWYNERNLRLYLWPRDPWQWTSVSSSIRQELVLGWKESNIKHLGESLPCSKCSINVSSYYSLWIRWEREKKKVTYLLPIVLP